MYEDLISILVLRFLKLHWKLRLRYHIASPFLLLLNLFLDNHDIRTKEDRTLGHILLLDFLLGLLIFSYLKFGLRFVKLLEDLIEVVIIEFLHVIFIIPLLDHLALAEKFCSILDLLLLVLLFLFFQLLEVPLDGLLVSLLEVHRVLRVNQNCIFFIQLVVGVVIS